LGKKEIATLFSSNPDKYYKVSLFDQVGFKRNQCSLCQKFFWSIVEKNSCPDHENYSFIGNPPTKKNMDYIATWKNIETYFRNNGHSIVSRYPVVCRWREDLYYTIASIVNFQRIMNDKIVFELPSNPLVVPQMCLRFNDIENVGLSGRHYTSFCMIGQTCNADKPGGYWKDKCMELDYGMLTQVLGINPEEITFVEDVWMGAGAFGYSLEYFVRGLELGNAVFTEFEGNADNYHIMENKIIDMGAGLERLSWITMGTPTSYDCCFGPVVTSISNKIGLVQNNDILSDYFKLVSKDLHNTEEDPENGLLKLKKTISNNMKISYDDLQKIISPYESLYTVVDHTRTLLFAISDGSLPSNVGGGYNLRILLRRVLSILERLQWKINLEDIIHMHIDHLKFMYPEIEEHRDDVTTILKIEDSRYNTTKGRMMEIVSSLKIQKKSLDINELIKLYESDGIPPDLLLDVGVIDSIPQNFYTKISELHLTQNQKNQDNIQSEDIYKKSVKFLKDESHRGKTDLLFYKDSLLREFSAKILKILDNKIIILDKTAFYPRGGGQEPDTGFIDDIPISETIKIGDTVLHKISSVASNTGTNILKNIYEGKIVKCVVNNARRDLITRHHTGTHILNSSARNVLGSWVWQHSAFKDENNARLDITHHSSLSKDEIQKIEQIANDVIMKNLPITIKFYDRGDSEQLFSFRIYQGGVVPSNQVRIVNINGWDIEACGGTHTNTTGELGLLKIIKSERIQDGVVRLEFVVGKSALEYVNKQEKYINHIVQSLGSSKEKIIESFDKCITDYEIVKKKNKTIIKKLSPHVISDILKHTNRIQDKNIKTYITSDDQLDEEYHIIVGENIIVKDPSLIYTSIIIKDKGIRVIVFVGNDAQKLGFHAGSLAKILSKYLGGSGGGDGRFGQGGGQHKGKIDELMNVYLGLVEKTIM